MWTIPNQITLFRIILIPIFVIIFYLPLSWSNFGAFAVFWIASISDILDGYLARKLNQSSPFGAFIDPVADKLMVVVSLVMIAQDYSDAWWVSIAAIIMIAREVFISALREFMASIGKRDVIAVSNMGKYKTAAQMLGIMGLIWQPNYDIPFIFFHMPHEVINYLAYGFYSIATILTITTCYSYFRAAWPELKGSTT